MRGLSSSFLNFFSRMHLFCFSSCSRLLPPHSSLLDLKKRSKNSFQFNSEISTHIFAPREYLLLHAYIVVHTKTTWEEEEYHAKTTMVSFNARNREEEDDDHDFDKKKPIRRKNSHGRKTCARTIRGNT